MKVFVKFEAETKEFDVAETATVGCLMSLLSDSFGIPVDNQRLVLRGKTLAARDSPLAAEGVKAGSRLLLIGSHLPVEPPRPAASFTNPGFLEFSSRQPRILSDEYLTAPPHSGIIQKGPPPGAMEGASYKLESLPAEPFIVRDAIGDEARLAFRSDDLIVNSAQSSSRLFYQEITSFGIQAIPGYEQRYLAVVFHVKGKKFWVYFVPKQYRAVIESILQHRRA
jgi:hypothetical protein